MRPMEGDMNIIKPTGAATRGPVRARNGNTPVPTSSHRDLALRHLSTKRLSLTGKWDGDAHTVIEQTRGPGRHRQVKQLGYVWLTTIRCSSFFACRVHHLVAPRI
jgi:hypothetical protein